MATVGKAKVKMNSSGVSALLSSEGVRSALAGPAASVLSAAKAGAPVASGTYQASLAITHATTDRAVERVGSSVAYALVVEAKTGNLARALGSV